MDSRTKLYALILICLSLVGCEKGEENEINSNPGKNDIQLQINDNQNIEIEREDTLQLTYQIVPVELQDSLNDLNWTSFEAAIATISADGELISISPGTTQISLTDQDKTIGDTIYVTVTPIRLNEYTLEENKPWILVEEGITRKVNVKFIPENADDKKLTWEIYRFSETDTKINQDGSFTPVGTDPFAICVKHAQDPTDVVDSYCAKSINVMVSPKDLKLTGLYNRGRNVHENINFIELNIGSLTNNFTLKNVKLYECNGFTFDKISLIEEKHLNVSVVAGEVETVELFEVSDEVANTLSFGSLLSCLVSINGKNYTLEIVADNEQIRVLE